MLIFSTFSGITSTAYMMVLNFRKPTRPSLPLRKAPPLISVFFNGLYTPFGSPVSGGQKPQGRRGKPPSGAQNRYAIRLAGHQSPAPYCAGWDRLTITCCYLSKAGLLLAPYEAVHNAAIIDAKPKGGFPSISQRLLIQEC